MTVTLTLTDDQAKLFRDVLEDTDGDSPRAWLRVRYISRAARNGDEAEVISDLLAATLNSIQEQLTGTPMQPPAQAVVLVSIVTPSGRARLGYALCDKHLSVRLENNTIASKDGAATTFFKCDDCKSE